MRRAEISHHHHIAGAYLLRYAQEASWREDNRRASNGEQVNRIARLAISRASISAGIGKGILLILWSDKCQSVLKNESSLPIKRRVPLEAAIYGDAVR